MGVDESEKRMASDRCGEMIGKMSLKERTRGDQLSMSGILC